ncbi:heterogeneous nuclear ribonucleoprotein 1-like [Zingiber officinale]|uniref:RRM domain-containing protein n=1 Tax=Zingiber officinale TaxID=94328 RepID=A0A8J5F5B5_ZINOF|nr:heterogeneous nuclear ribonucleoprotein 1-like [Zingiber officinale]KAG6478868.1 hypothetical protein ZIOFF_062313 [Zingiber officinale]
MGMDQGKLFIGGISWDTNEDGLREHFGQFGEVVEAVIMKDRNTGRARGFGFVVFTDPAVAERVVMEKHTIDGRVVDVKKAVPRDDQQVLNRSSNSIHGSLSPGRTKKIFVGGLPSTITENDFKKYFDQFGTITDVVVMYDHNTQRPRGFGFITYDTEEAVDKVLFNTFHDLNGKKVEVKRAVPKELSPGPSTRLQTVGFNYGVNRGNNFLSGHAQGYNPSSISDYGMRMDSRLGALSTGRNGLPSLGPAFGMGLDYNRTLNSGIVGNTDVGNILNYGRVALNSFYGGGNSSRYDGPIPYSGLNRNTSTFRSSMAQTLLGNTGLNYSVNSSTASASMTSGSGGLGSFSNSSLNWGGSVPNSLQFGGSRSGYGSSNVSYIGTDNLALGGNSFERRVSPPVANTNLTSLNSGYEVSFEDLYGGNLVYGDPTWRPSLSDVDDTGSFSYRLGNSDADSGKEFVDYIGGYDVNNRQTD